VKSVSLFRVGPARPAQRRLICVPFAGGGVAAFRPWSRVLPADVELLVVQLPGRESRVREAPFDDVHEIVRALAPVMREVSDLPFALFGHSMGALVAFELTRALERAGQPAPQRLFVSARRAPDDLERDPPVHDLPDAAFMDALQERYGAIPEAVRQEPELLALLLPPLRADIRAIERYAPLTHEPVRCPLRIYGGADDRHPAPAQLAGWQRVATQAPQVRLFPGDHFYLTAQHEALVADIFAHWPAEARVGAPS